MALVAASEGSSASEINLLSNQDDDIRYSAGLQVINQGMEQLNHAANLLSTAQWVVQVQELTIRQLRDWATKRPSLQDADMQTTKQRVDDAEVMHRDAGDLTDTFLAKEFQVFLFALSKWRTICQRIGACHIYCNCN